MLLDGPQDQIRTLGEELIREGVLVVSGRTLKPTRDFPDVLEYLYRKWFAPLEPTCGADTASSPAESPLPLRDGAGG
jgi:hypothetical protein